MPGVGELKEFGSSLVPGVRGVRRVREFADPSSSRSSISAVVRGVSSSRSSISAVVRGVSSSRSSISAVVRNSWSLEEFDSVCLLGCRSGLVVLTLAARLYKLFLSSGYASTNSRFLGEGPARGAPGPVRFLCILLSFLRDSALPWHGYWVHSLCPWPAHRLVSPSPTALVGSPNQGSRAQVHFDFVGSGTWPSFVQLPALRVSGALA
jgi:hypothetical protein